MAFGKFLRPMLALAAGALLWPGQAPAQGDNIFAVKTTGDLITICTFPEDDPMRPSAINYCLGYVDGAVDYHDVLTAHEDLKPLVCYPETATLELGASVFIAWGKEQDSDDPIMGTPPVQGVIKALAQKWPCT